MSDVDDRSGDFGESPGDAGTGFRLPLFDLSADSFVTLSTKARIACACESAKTSFISFQLMASTSADCVRHPRSRNLSLPDSAEALPEERLDGLDPRAVIGNRDLLPEALPALGTRAGCP